jgi:hypothetical protein
MEIGIALDGTGRLGQPAAVTAVAAAADQLGYGSVWCIGPWAATLVGAVVAASSRVRIGIETRDAHAVRTARLLGGDRLVVVDRLPAWFAPARDRAGSGLVRLDARAGAITDATVELAAARASGVAEVVVRLIDDPGTDEALAAYAELGELVEGSPTARS